MAYPMYPQQSAFPWELYRGTYRPVPDVPPPPPASGYSPTTRFYGGTEIFQQDQGGEPPVSPVTGARVGWSPYGRPLTGQLRPEQYGQVLAQDPNVTRSIREASLRRFGSTPDQTVVGLVNKVVNEGFPLEEALRQINRNYGISDPDLREAADKTAMQFDPQMNQLQRNVDQIQQFLGRDIRTQQLMGSQADQTLRDIYGQLNSVLQGNVGATQALWDQARGQVGEGYAAAQRATSEATGAVRGNLEESMKRLGLEAAAPAPLASLESDLARINAQTASSQAAATGNLAQMGGTLSSLAQLAVGEAAREGASMRGNVQQRMMSAIGDLQAQAGIETNELLAQLGDLSSARGSALRSTLMEVANARTDRERQSRLDALEEEIQRGTLELQRGQLQLDRQQAQWGQHMDVAQLGMEQQRMQMEQRRFALEQQLRQLELEQARNPQGDPLLQLQAEKLRAEIDRINSQTGLNVSKIMEPGGGKMYSGQVGLDQFLNAPSTYWGETGAGPKFRQGLYDILQQAQAIQAGAIDPAELARSYPGLVALGGNRDPYAIANIMARQYGQGLSPEALARAISIYFGKF